MDVLEMAVQSDASAVHVGAESRSEVEHLLQGRAGTDWAALPASGSKDVFAGHTFRDEPCSQLPISYSCL